MFKEAQGDIYSTHLSSLVLSCVHAPPENNEDEEDREVKDTVDMYKWDVSGISSRSRWASSFKFYIVDATFANEFDLRFAGGKNAATTRSAFTSLREFHIGDRARDRRSSSRNRVTSLSSRDPNLHK